jgi:hypothetical protein
LHVLYGFFIIEPLFLSNFTESRKEHAKKSKGRICDREPFVRFRPFDGYWLPSFSETCITTRTPLSFFILVRPLQCINSASITKTGLQIASSFFYPLLLLRFTVISFLSSFNHK